MEQLKKAGRFLCSMKCAIALLIVMALACTAGSLIPQGESIVYYTEVYSETAAGAILLFHLDDVFHCWWFAALTLFLCVNLLACNVLRFPALIRRTREGFTLTKRLAEWDGKPAAVTAEDPEKIFRGMGFRTVKRGVAEAARIAGWEAESEAVGVGETGAEVLRISGQETERETAGAGEAGSETRISGQGVGSEAVGAGEVGTEVPRLSGQEAESEAVGAGEDEAEAARISGQGVESEAAGAGEAGSEVLRIYEREGRTGQMGTCYAVRNRLGVWGAWLCHLGMLVVIAGFGLGQMFQVQYTVYGVPGQTKPIGDTGYELRIDDFQVKLREDDTVEQYETAMTVSRTDGTGQTGGEEGTASVNHPLTLFGMKFYQNSTGWAAGVEIRKNGEKLQEGVLCAGEYALVEDMEGLAVMFNAFYPDYARGADGMPVTLSSSLNNPGYLYTLYYHDQILGMNVLEEGQTIQVEDYEIVFQNPQPYTLIQIKKDPFTPLAAAGGALVMLSLILAFYLTPEEVWAVRRPDGTWALAGKSRKSGAFFLENLAKAGAGNGTQIEN